MIINEFYKRMFTSILLLPILIYSIFANNFLFNIILILSLCISLYEWFNTSKRHLFDLIIGILFIFAAIMSAYYLKGNKLETQIIFLWILSIGIFSDIGGYTFGKILGGKKLTKISPSKTIYGSIGSFIFSLLPILIFHFHWIFFKIDFTFYPFPLLSIKTFLISLFLSLISQTGDIIVSFYKRKNNVKDTGNLLPGHGGLLDRIDGIIFLLIFSIFLKYLNLI
jgi:phosphatidate cytidylyltransferase